MPRKKKLIDSITDTLIQYKNGIPQSKTETVYFPKKYRCKLCKGTKLVVHMQPWFTDNKVKMPCPECAGGPKYSTSAIIYYSLNLPERERNKLIDM